MDYENQNQNQISLNQRVKEEKDPEEHMDMEDKAALFLKSFPPGYRFRPLDEELIFYYLKAKLFNQPLPPNLIIEVELYNYNPEILIEKNKSYGEGEWYFFTPRDKKYKNGLRPRRAAGDGYWKATGADRTIEFQGIEVGYRKALVFYRGKPPKGDKTDWMMHEFRLKNPPALANSSIDDMRLDDWVLCKIYKKSDKSLRTANEANELQILGNTQDQDQLDSTEIMSPQLLEQILVEESSISIPAQQGVEESNITLPAQQGFMPYHFGYFGNDQPLLDLTTFSELSPKYYDLRTLESNSTKFLDNVSSNHNSYGHNMWETITDQLIHDDHDQFSTASPFNYDQFFDQQYLFETKKNL